jgi:hypothetical protein
MRCYTDYQVEGEADGAEKYPEHYMIASAPGQYINTSMTVAGNSYRGAGVEELQKKAEELGTVIRLQSDFNGKIVNDAKIYTNGYEMNPAEGSFAANIVYDQNTGNYIYQFDEDYNSLKVVYHWYVGEYGNLEQMKNPAYYVTTEVIPGQTPAYVGEPIPSIKDAATMAQKIHCGWHSAGDEFTVEELIPVTISMAIAQAGKPIYMYPSYYDTTPTAYVEDESGNVVDIATNAYEASKLLSKLAPGQTFVVCESFELDNAYINNIYTADKATYGGKSVTREVKVAARVALASSQSFSPSRTIVSGV